MDLSQRVIRRSRFVVWSLNALLAVAAVLFVHAVVRQNMAGGSHRGWLWSWQVLDVQSATTALLAVVGAILARAQYARAVRPMLGHSAWPTADSAPGGRLAWTSFLTNGSHDAVVVQAVRYRVDFSDTGESSAARSTGWVSWNEAMEAVEARGLRSGEDYRFTSLGSNAVLSGEIRLFLAWFTEPAMAVIADAYVQVDVLDRIGDLHRRTVSCLKDADRVMTHPVTSLI